jgi:hypothetical protein
MLLVCGHAGLLPAGSDVLSRRAALGAAAAALASRGQPAAASSRPAEAQAQPFSASASAERLLLDGSASLVDSSQEYDRARSLLYDTRSGSFLPPDPRRRLPTPPPLCRLRASPRLSPAACSTHHHPLPTTHHALPTRRYVASALRRREAEQCAALARTPNPNPNPSPNQVHAVLTLTRCTPR